MRPRHISRGNFQDVNNYFVPVRSFNEAAAYQPRKPIACGAGVPFANSFNEAAAYQPRKRGQ